MSPARLIRSEDCHQLGQLLLVDGKPKIWFILQNLFMLFGFFESMCLAL